MANTAAQKRHHKRSYIRRMYGIDLEEWEALYARLYVEQEGRCRFCGVAKLNQLEIEDLHALKPIDYLVTDHNHETGEIRCVGSFADNFLLMHRAAALLEQHSRGMLEGRTPQIVDMR